ncbi:acyltransferase family protein [Roseivivax sp.]
MTEAFAAYRARARFGALDGLRAFAILAVLYHHSPVGAALRDGPVLATRGFLGVDLFFIISGYLITTLLLREEAALGRISLRGFYKRRALRILPLYLLVVTVVGGYYVLLKDAPGAAERWPFYYLFLANFLTADIPTLAPMWSLSVEEQYYLLWPLVLILLPRRWLLAVLGVLIALNLAGVMGLLWLRPPEVGPLRFALPTATYAPILMGSALAWVLHREAGFARLWPWLGARTAAPLCLALLLALLWLLPSDLTGLPNFALHLSMTALLGSLVLREAGPVYAVLRLRPLMRIGVVSYGIYLLHLPVLTLVDRAGAALGVAPGGLIFHLMFWGAAWGAAELSFRYFERPFLALRHKPLGRLRVG